MNQVESHDDVVLEQMSEPEIVSHSIICRLCANPNDRIIGIYSEEGISNNLADKMNRYLPVQVSENDFLPLQCCWSCASTVLAWHELYLASAEADRRLREVQIVSVKQALTDGDYCDSDDDNSLPEVQEDNTRSKLKTPEASLSVFCQDTSQTEIEVKEDKLAKNDWLNCDTVVDETFEKYMNLEDTFDVDDSSLEKDIKNEKTSSRSTRSVKREKEEIINETHSEDTDGYNFSCMYCPRMFVTEESILNHVKEEHEGQQSEFNLQAGKSKSLSKKDRRKNTKIDQDVVNAAKVVVDGRIYYNCKVCGKSLHSPYTYVWHMRIHTGERPYVCDLCGKQFRVSQGLVRHLRETHQGIKNFGCDICGRMFATRRNVEEHRRIHTNERPYICDLCGKSFKQKASLFVHNRSHNDSFPFKCTHCNQGFRTRPPLLIHVTRHTGEKPYQCDICGRCFRIKYELKRHKLIHSEDKPFSCSECGLSFRQKRYLRNHNKVNHNRITPFEEKYCADIKIRKEEIRKDDVKPQESFTCSLCSLNFTSTKYLNIHEYKTHGVGKSNLSDVGCFICDICKSTFKRRCDMLKHLRIQHAPAENRGTKRRRVDISYKIFCDLCNLGFTRSVDMKRHKIKIHGKTKSASVSDETLSCESCQKNFKTRIELNRHLKKEHGQAVPRFRRSKSDIIAEHFCDVCQKGFTRKYDMQKHRTNKHPDEPKVEQEPTQQQKNLQLLNRCKVASGDNKNYYKCEVCSRIFRQSYNFMRHQSVHTGVRAFFCHICGKNFRVSSGLYRHITEHHYGVKKYDCDVCGRSFAAKATRDDHKNIHTDHRPFICDICGKAFRQKASLYIHKLFHSDNFRYSCNYCGKKYRRASELKIHTWLHTGHKPHHCGKCGARFRQRQDLKRHEKIHDKFSEHSCDDCGSTFSQKRFLKNHMKTHESI